MTPAERSCLCLCVCVYQSVCLAFMVYILLSMGRILIKLGENVATLVRLIVLKFEHSAAKEDTTHKGKHFFPSYSLLFFNDPYLVIWPTYFIFGTNA